MGINFKDRKLRQLCEHQTHAQREFGEPCARKLRARLDDLQAAACVTELIAGQPHPLRGKRAGQFALDLHRGARLVFEPNHNPIPRQEAGGIDWSCVTRIRIIYIGDYHD